MYTKTNTNTKIPAKATTNKSTKQPNKHSWCKWAGSFIWIEGARSIIGALLICSLFSQVLSVMATHLWLDLYPRIKSSWHLLLASNFPFVWTSGVCNSLWVPSVTAIRCNNSTESFQEEISVVIITPGLSLCPRRPQHPSEASDSENYPDPQWR